MKPIVYKSKISPWIFAPILGVFAVVLTIIIYNEIWLIAILLLLPLAFIIHMLLTTFYIISDTALNIRCGFLYNQTINISTIKKITETNNPISSPATSLDRLEIAYNKYDRVLISPANKTVFIAHLLKLNPDIEIKLKNSLSKSAH